MRTRVPIPSPGTDDVPTRRGASTRTVMLVALTVALLAGLAGLGLGARLTADSDEATGISADTDPSSDPRIAAACEILERNDDELPIVPGGLSLQEGLAHELSAAGNLFVAAGIEGSDEADQAIWTAGQDLVYAGRTLDFEQLNENVETLRATACT